MWVLARVAIVHTRVRDTEEWRPCLCLCSGVDGRTKNSTSSCALRVWRSKTLRQRTVLCVVLARSKTLKQRSPFPSHTARSPRQLLRSSGHTSASICGSSLFSQISQLSCVLLPTAPCVYTLLNKQRLLVRILLCREVSTKTISSTASGTRV